MAPITPALAQEPELDPDALEAAEISAQAAPAATMNHQGYLTDIGGVPLNGNFDMAFILWDDSVGGVKRWGDERWASRSQSRRWLPAISGWSPAIGVALTALTAYTCRW